MEDSFTLNEATPLTEVSQEIVTVSAIALEFGSVPSGVARMYPARLDAPATEPIGASV
jgi:hypothetical protein